MIDSILQKSLEGQRISPEEALLLLSSNEWTKMVAAAHQKRLQIHPLPKVSYTAFRVINYTNYCNIDCAFCSFKDELESNRGYVLTPEQISEKIEGAKRFGADGIFLQGGVNPNLDLSYYLEVFELITQSHGMKLRALSPVEIYHLAKKENLSIETLLEILKKHGLSSVPGAGAEILTENMRTKLSPKKLSKEDWCMVMGLAHQAGLPGSSNIVFGSDETLEDITEHLDAIRVQQDKTGGFLSFIPWVFQPQTKNFTIRHVKKWEYLRLLAVSRLFFDNIPNIEVSVMVMGKDIAELALSSGANDISSIVIEENVLKSYGLKTLESAMKFIENAGYQPWRRDMDYGVV